MPRDIDFGERLHAQTTEYLDRLSDCVDRLPALLDEYEPGGEYGATVEEIQAIESECDGMLREITGYVTEAGPEDIGLLNTRITHNESALLELFGTVDTVANLTERIAQELQMIEPARDNDCFRGLREMADEIVGMTATLATLVDRFVDSLRHAEDSETFAEEIQSIRDAESRCDDLRNGVITTAFDDKSIEQPLLYREFAILFDELANTIEDVTDQIVIVASEEQGIATEPDTDGE
ncbi:DUF47 family protein [Halapricum sp. CBA1109]|uniref:DUF47 domain-containing protein n=1 Tax=Halapricum sp. CBA1109 TaxID=2668068 RepID=UPI0012FC41C7|nr:DUF47 family protein [Halapricum sp. CBA1109]MUV89387.1 DUF47 family protein [Halapricum sp. CBA1109]